MKIYFLILIALTLYLKCEAQTGSLPFTIDIEEIDSSIADLPAMHSFAFAKSGSRWLILTGRAEGLHGFSTNNSFEAAYANSNVWVIDTAAWLVYSMPVDSLDSVYHALLRTTNTEYYQEGNHLFILGGYTWEASSGFYTAPTIVSIDVDEMINAVIAQSPSLAMQQIRNTMDTVAAVAGGKLMKLGNDFYLVMGHRFDGLYNQQFVIYTQTYTEAFRKFNIVDNGTTVSISNYSYLKDTANFHRRDLNVEYYMDANLNMGIAAYGGVFRKNQDWPFLNPVFFDGTNYSVDTFQQKMSQYTCPVVSAFDSTTKNMYQIFFGGIGLYNYNDTLQQLLLDSLVPFTDDITVQLRRADGSIADTMLGLKMPGLLGANMNFISSEGGSLFVHGIYNLREMNGRKMIGYLYGGIRATQPNAGLSAANGKIYRVYLNVDFATDTTTDTTFVHELSTESIKVYPNPANQKLFVRGYPLLVNEITITDVLGRNCILPITNNNNPITEINISKLSPGVYTLTIRNKNGTWIKKVVKE